MGGEFLAAKKERKGHHNLRSSKVFDPTYFTPSPPQERKRKQPYFHFLDARDREKHNRFSAEGTSNKEKENSQESA